MTSPTPEERIDHGWLLEDECDEGDEVRRARREAREAFECDEAEGRRDDDERSRP